MGGPFCFLSGSLLHMPSAHPRRSLAMYWLLLVGALLILAWISYSPGLHGDFLFDDYANLPALGESGPIINWPAFWRFVTSGHADPIGRPIAVMSFLLDAHDWPAAPFPFKRTNLVLHLCNGILLMLLLRRLGHAISQRIGKNTDRSTPDLIAWRIDLSSILGAALWLLHPLFLSTTLYIVQREAMLPATFTLVGLMLWIQGRDVIARGKIVAGLIWIFLGLAGCTVLAVLCKANGILLPSLALVIEFTLLRYSTPRSEARPYRYAMYAFAWLPTTLIALYLVWEGWHGVVYGISSVRPWTLWQRLLTEPRVLMDYLALMWLPRPFTAGLFNDQTIASISLWSPGTTLPSIIVVIGLLVGGIVLRKRMAPLAAAILFYFVGQSLESSTVPLELYFEHRNYLPAMLMFWPLALWLCEAYPVRHAQARDHLFGGCQSQKISVWKLVLAAVIVLGLALVTHTGSQLWGDARDQALVWAKLNPESPRAQVNAAEVEMEEGGAALAEQRLQPLLAKYPDQVQVALNLLGAECLMRHIKPTTLDAAQVALTRARDPGTLLVSWFTRVIDQTTRPPCPQLTPSTVEVLLDSALENNNFKEIPGRLQDIYYLKGVLALKQGLPDAALIDFNHASDLQVRIALALQQAALLGTSGYPQLGLSHLAHYESQQAREVDPGWGMPRIHAWVLKKQNYWPNEMARLKATLLKDAAYRTSTQP